MKNGLELRFESHHDRIEIDTAHHLVIAHITFRKVITRLPNKF
jgi:hypothetical protein